MTSAEYYNGLDDVYRLRLEAFVTLLQRELQVAEGYPNGSTIRTQQQDARQILEGLTVPEPSVTL